MPGIMTLNCPACNHEVAAAARFCTGCGARLGVRCPSCGAGVADGQKFCSDCGVDLRAGAATPGVSDEGERRQATIVFSDLTGYTALNERLDPEEVEVIMGRIKHEALAIIEGQGGVVNQFIGDEVVALFGIPVARRDDAHRAVRAAMLLHAAVRAIGAEVAGSINRQLSMHTGVNTGLIVVRRSDSRDGHYLLTGDAVNTGARLLGLAAADEVVVGQDTWRQIADVFDAVADAPIEVKGKEQPLVPYRIRGERMVDGAGGSEDKLPVMVGRGDELDQLDALLKACLSLRRGRVVILRGDPGIGKSRMLSEVRARATSLGFACHAALVLDFSAERGHDAIRSLTRSLLTTPEGVGAARASAATATSEQARRATLKRAIEVGLVAPEREVFLCDLLDLEPASELRAVQAALSEEARKQGTLATLCELVRAAGEQKSLLLSVEDVHWADHWTLECLAALATLTRDGPLLMALTTRFENDPSAGTWRAALQRVPTTGIDLGPLRADEAVRLAERFATLSNELVRSCIEKADGNPLFLEQLLINGQDTAQTGLPGTIQALVLTRMDRLAPAQRQALQAASVLGQRFSRETLRHLLADPAFECDVLVQNFLVRPEGSDFLFCHALIRDGAYESLLRSRRRQLHTLAAEWFVAVDPTLAAEHYERAEHPLAAQACLAACEAEAKRYHYAAALRLAERGLAKAASPGDRSALAAACASILLDMGRPHEAMQAWRDALKMAERDDDRCRALIGLAQVMRTVDRTDEGLAALAEAEPLAQQGRLTQDLARLHHLRGNFYFGVGRGEECLREHELALASARAAGSVEAQADALGGLGDAYYLVGRMRSAHRQFSQCVELAQRHGLGRVEVANRHMVGWSAHYLNDLRGSIDAGKESIHMASLVSHRRVEAIARHLVAYVQGWLIGDTIAAREQLDVALDICRALGAKRFEGHNMVLRASLELRGGDRVRAAELARQALVFCRQNGMAFYGPVALGLVARLCNDREERGSLNAEAEALLAGGAIGHNYFEFYAMAIDAALECGEWDAAAHFCTKLERYTAGEPLPLSDFVIARGRALARHGRGVRDGQLIQELRELRQRAVRHELNLFVPSLDAALQSVPAETPH